MKYEKVEVCDNLHEQNAQQKNFRKKIILILILSLAAPILTFLAIRNYYEEQNYLIFTDEQRIILKENYMGDNLDSLVSEENKKFSQSQNKNNQLITVSALNIRAGISALQKQKSKEYIRLKYLPLTSPLAQEEKSYYQQKYIISQYPQLPICVVIPSFNNAEEDRYLKNINSILQQDYSNYHIVFIDDFSGDGTGTKMEQFAQKHQISKEKLKIIINTERTMAMPNIYRAAHEFCKSYELFMIVDGDDELIGKQVFKFFNAIFQSRNLWLVYSNFLTVRGSLGYSRAYSEYIIKGQKFRKAPFTISHLRVFYTKLLTLINKKDLKDEKGNWFRAANDVAMYIPIMEIVHTRMAYIPQLTYMYNSNTGLNNHKVKLNEQKKNEKIVKDKQPYKALDALFSEQQIQQQKKETGRKIPIKDPSLPKFQKVQQYAWEL